MSKGGDSSNSASAQTPSQWASALSNASISAWKEADILGFSVAQLKALSPGQISNISVPWAVPMAVWTAETLNAVPLQYWSQWGTRYLSTTSNGVTSITPLSQSSNGAVSGKNNWFDDVGRGASGFAFTPSVVAGISNERIAQIGGGLGRNQSHAPSFATNAGYVSPSDFTATLSAATASGANVVTWHISASQTAYMFASGWADMGADFMGALTYSQLGAIAHPETALGAAQFGYLSANQLTALGQLDWSKVTSAQLNATKISAFQGLQSHILQAISAQTWAGLDKAHTTALNAADVQLLPATTIAQMNYFGYALTASVGAVLTAAQVASIPSACWAQISDGQFLNSLSTAAFQAIPVSAFASMVDAVVGSLDHVHVAALTAHQAQNYPLSKLSDASSAFYQNPNTLNFETFVAQSNVNWALAPASFIKLLTPAQLRLISPSQMSALSPTALSALTRAQTQVLSLAQIQALSASQLSAMAYIARRTDVVQEVFGASQLAQLRLSFWSNVDSNFLNALTIGAFQAITTTQLQAIAAGAFANLDQAHVNALTGTQLLALSAEQVGQFSGAYLSIAFLRGVRLEAFKGLVPDQMHHLHDYLFNTVVSNAFDTTDPTLLRNAENQFASLLASILESDDGREAWLQQSVTLLMQLRWLDATVAANLLASDVTATYSALNWSWMSGAFLNSISTAVFAQIRASSVAQFNLAALAELNDTHLQALTAEQASALSGAQLSAIGNLGALSASVVQSLSAVQLAGVNQDWSQISAHFLNNMTAGQFMSLPPSQFGQLAAAQLSATAIDWRLIGPEQLNALSLSEFENLCTGANPAILNTTSGVVLNLGGDQLSVLAQQSVNYSALQMNALLNCLLDTFTTEQTSRLIVLMKNDSAEQIVLQTGLVALLAKMDGSTDGIDAAIQTLVSLRQMQPAWFSTENLSAVLPALSEQYSNYLQAYQVGLTTQNLYHYVFLSQNLNNLLQARQGAGLAGQSKTAIATSTSLALGNLLVMLGAGINALGLAIEASSNNKLSKKERDNLIASASLNAVAAVAQGLQLGVNVVLRALMRHYTGGTANNVPTAVELNVVQAFENLLPEAVAIGAQRHAATAVELPVQEVLPLATVVEVINQPRTALSPDALPTPSSSSVLPPDSTTPRVPGRQVLDMSRPAEGVLLVAGPSNPADTQSLTPNAQFQTPLEDARAQAMAAHVQQNSRLTDEGWVPEIYRPKSTVVTPSEYQYSPDGLPPDKRPHLLNVDENGLAVVIINGDVGRMFAQQFTRWASADASFQSVHEALTGQFIQRADIQDIVTRSAAAGKPITTIVPHSVSSQLPVDKNRRMVEILNKAQAGQADIASGRFVLDNLDRFVYWAWRDAMQKAPSLLEGQYSVRAIVLSQLREYTRTLFGLSRYRYDDASITDSLYKALYKITRTAGLADFMIDDAVLMTVLHGGDRLTEQEFIHRVQRQLSTMNGDIRVEGEVIPFSNAHVISDARVRLGQAQLIDFVKSQSLSNLGRQMFENQQMTLQDLRAVISEAFGSYDISTHDGQGQAASNAIVVDTLLDYGARVSAHYASEARGFFAIHDRIVGDEIVNDMLMRSALLAQAQSIDWKGFVQRTHPAVESLLTTLSIISQEQMAHSFYNDYLSNYDHELSPWGRIVVEGALAGALVRKFNVMSTNFLQTSAVQALLKPVTQLGDVLNVDARNPLIVEFARQFKLFASGTYQCIQEVVGEAVDPSPNEYQVAHVRAIDYRAIGTMFKFLGIDYLNYVMGYWTNPHFSGELLAWAVVARLGLAHRTVELNTMLLERAVTAWAYEAIQEHGAQLIDDAGNPLINRYIKQCLSTITDMIGPERFSDSKKLVPKVETAYFVDDQILLDKSVVGIKDASWQPLYEKIIDNLKRLNVDEKYFVNPQSTAQTDAHPSAYDGLVLRLPSLSISREPSLATVPEAESELMESHLNTLESLTKATRLMDLFGANSDENARARGVVTSEMPRLEPAVVARFGEIEVLQANDAVWTDDEPAHNVVENDHPTVDTPPAVMVNENATAGPQNAMRRTGIARTQVQLDQLKMATMNYGMLGFALFSSVLGIAAGLAGIIYAAQSTTLSWQAKAMVLVMNGVRVLTSGVMLVAAGAQIASSVVKGVQAAADTATIANAGFAIGNVIGITTNIAQIGIQADTVETATDSTTRLIAGLAILDSVLQLILNVVGTIALAFGPEGMVVNLITFVIASLLPSAAAITTAVEYRKSYNDLTGQGLYKEAEIMYMNWQVAAMDASPIVNWTSSIYTEEMKKTQERKMDHAWMDKSAEERLLYSLRSSTTLKDNFDSLRAQMYAGAVALTQPLGNLSQTLTRSTMLMLSQDNLSYFEGDKQATVKLAGTLNYATNSVSRAPKLLGANVNGQVLSLGFNQDLASLGSQLPNLSSFSVLVNGTAVTVSGLAVLNNIITLSLATAVTAGQTVTFSYSDPTAGNDSKAVQNVLGVDLASIVNYSVVNGLDSDKRAPKLADAVAQDNFLTLVFDEALSTAADKVPEKGAFSVLVNGSAVHIYNLGVHDQRVLLSLNSPIAVGATVTVSYNANYGDGALQDSAGNLVASLNAQRVDNTGATSTVTASRVGWLQYDNFVSSVQGTGTEAASVLNGSDYTVYATAGDATSGTSRLRYLSLSNAAGEFDMLSVTRAVENNDRIWLDASNAQGVNNFAINTHDMMVWGGQGKNSYSLARPYAAQSYIVAANAWSDKNNVISISGSASDTSKKVNLDYFLTADNISAGLPVTQNTFTVLGANDGLDVVVGSGDNQSYMATSNVANINLTGANANVSVGESAQVSVGVNGRVQVDMDMWRGLNVAAPTAGAVNGVIKGNYGKYSLLNFTPTDSINTNFNGKLNLSYQIGHLPRLDAFSVYVGSTLVGVNNLSVKGKTLTLNLRSAVAQNEVVSISYADVSSADDDNTLQGLTGKDVDSFSKQAVVNTTADNTPPKLAVATVQGNSLIVHFSEALQQSYPPLNSAWAVYVNGTRVAVTRVAFNDSSSLRLTLASAVNAGQTVNLNYSATSDTSLAVQDLAGNVTSSFSSASVINLANVTQAPNLRTVTANGNVLTLTFDGTVRYTLSNPSAFVVTANNTPLNISGVSVAGNSVLLYLSSAVSSGQLVEVSYNAPQQVSDATTLRDWLGNTVGSISAQVANNITGQDLTPPSLQYAVANGTSLVLTFSEVLNNQAGFTPLPSGFAVNVNGKAANVTQALVSGSTVTLTLATAANYGDTMTLSYSDLSAGNDAAVVQDVAGNDAASFANVHVINNTPDTTPPSLLSATVKGNQLSLLFSESLNTSSGYLPVLTRMAVNVGGVAVSIIGGNVSGSTATLTLGTAVNAGDYVTFNYTAPSNASDLQAFQDGSGNDLLSIANFNVTNLTGLDLTPPSLVSAQVNGTILTLTFSEALASTASFTPGASAFKVSVDGNLATVSGVRLNGTQAVLTLASAVDSTAKVTVGYVRPSDASSTQAIQDGAQNMAASFSAQSVSNVTADTAPPSLSSASVAGAIVTLTFSENLATTPTLLASANQFVVTVDGQAVDVLSAVSSGNSVSITLSKAVTASQKVSVDYTVSTSGTNYLQDVANNKTANFSRTVQNSSGLASIQNATVNGTTLSMIFNQELDANSTHLPPLSAFAVKVNGVSSAVSNLAVNGHVVTLTLGAAVTAGQKVTVNYTSTDNDLTALQNRGGLDVQSFSAPYAVHNLSVAPEAATPSLSNAKVNGSTLTLTFGEALDAGVGEWWVNYLPDGQYDASGNPVVTSRVKASGFVNVLGSNSNDSFIIGDQSGLDVSRQLDYVQLGNGQGVQVNYYDTSGNLFLAMGNKGQANVILESGSSLQKLLTAKLVQGDADIAHFKANRDTVTLKSLSSLTAFLSGYETIDATDSTSSLTAEIGEGDHQIKLGGQTVHLEFDKVASTTNISTRQIPNSWLDEQYFNFKGMNADGLWVGRESDGTVLFRAQWKDGAGASGANDVLNVSYDGTLSNVVFEVGNVVSGSKTSQLRLDKLIEAMSAPAFSIDPNAASHAMTDADTSTKLYRITDIVAYSAASQPTVTGGV